MSCMPRDLSVRWCFCVSLQYVCATLHPCGSICVWVVTDFICLWELTWLACCSWMPSRGCGLLTGHGSICWKPHNTNIDVCCIEREFFFSEMWSRAAWTLDVLNLHHQIKTRKQRSCFRIVCRVTFVHSSNSSFDSTCKHNVYMLNSLHTVYNTNRISVLPVDTTTIYLNPLWIFRHRCRNFLTPVQKKSENQMHVLSWAACNYTSRCVNYAPHTVSCLE